MLESPSNDMRTCIRFVWMTMKQLKLGTSNSLLAKKCQKHVENIPLLSSCGRAICWQGYVALWWPWCVTLIKLDAPTIWFPSTAKTCIWALPSSVATSASAFGGLTAKKTTTEAQPQIRAIHYPQKITHLYIQSWSPHLLIKLIHTLLLAHAYPSPFVYCPLSLSLG